jgi:hypothetical protein
MNVTSLLMAAPLTLKKRMIARAKEPGHDSSPLTSV